MFLNVSKMYLGCTFVHFYAPFGTQTLGNRRRFYPKIAAIGVFDLQTRVGPTGGPERCAWRWFIPVMGRFAYSLFKEREWLIG